MRAALLLLITVASAAGAEFQKEAVFPLDARHNHASALVELPNGDLLVCWYRGSGERTADDVQVLGARKRKGAARWSEPFLLADVAGFPDTNPTLLVDSRKRLWLIWQTIVANEWHTALTQYRISTKWDTAGAPQWQVSEPLLVVPRDFAATVKPVVEAMPPTAWTRRTLERAGDKYFSRMGWMTRAHPVELPSGRILVPLYSDGYDFSLMAITDDGGRSWRTSTPLVSHGGVQPAIARRKDGSLVAYMRDNGPPPKRLLRSESRDEGLTWSAVADTDIPNPGAGVDIATLRDGTWALVNNDLEKGRHSLAIWLSDDEGRSWKWKRHIERDDRGEGAGSFHYPSIVQTRDGRIHVSYSLFRNHIPNGQPRKTIEHAWFDVDWVKQGPAQSSRLRKRSAEKLMTATPNAASAAN